MNDTMMQGVALSGTPLRLQAAMNRATALNLGTAQLLALAGALPVSASTLQRWIAGRTEPRLATFERTLRILERVLAAEEARIGEVLARLDRAA